MPNAKLLTRTLALTRDEDVGIVQTPQNSFNPDPIQANLAVEGVWPNEQGFFFDFVLPSEDARGGAFCCDTSSGIRYSPLLEIGGFPTDSVTEDYLVTLRLNEIGYRTVYLNEPLSLGSGPEGLKEYITQRSPRALGFMQICRGPSGPLSLSGRTPLLGRIMLAETFLHWSATHMSPAARADRSIGLSAVRHPSRVCDRSRCDIESLSLPCGSSRRHHVDHQRARPSDHGRPEPVVGGNRHRQVGRLGLIRPIGHKFKVTAKGGDRSHGMVQWPMLRIFLVYLAFTAAGVIWEFSSDDASALALFWSWFNIVILVLACMSASKLRSAAPATVSARGARP